MESTAVLFTDVGRVELAEVEIPPPGPGEVLVESAYTCISPGTELRCLAGRQPYQPPWPIIPGYSIVGRVVETGRETSLAEGTLVFCQGTIRASVKPWWGGHVRHAVVAESQVFPLPAGADLLDFAAAKLAAIAYHGMRIALPKPEHHVVIMGLGPIGLLSAKMYMHAGATVVGIDPRPQRVDFARECGIEATTPNDAVALEGAQDVVVDATGVPEAFAEAVRLAKTLPWDDEVRPGARIVIQGCYPDVLPVPYQDAFYKEATLLLPRDCQPRDIRAAIDMIASGELRVRSLITDVFATADGPSVYAELQKPDTHMMTAAFRWS